MIHMYSLENVLTIQIHIDVDRHNSNLYCLYQYNAAGSLSEYQNHDPIFHDPASLCSYFAFMTFCRKETNCYLYGRFKSHQSD